MARTINYHMLVEWLDNAMEIAEKNEAKWAQEGEHLQAFECETEKVLWRYLKDIITTDDPIEIADFVENTASDMYEVAE